MIGSRPNMQALSALAITCPLPQVKRLERISHLFAIGFVICLIGAMVAASVSTELVVKRLIFLSVFSGFIGYLAMSRVAALKHNWQIDQETTAS